MAYYMKKVEQLKDMVNDFISEFAPDSHSDIRNDCIIQLAHIVNMSVRCNPRQAQGTVRKNIVSGALEEHCNVTMTKEHDKETGRDYNKIHITSR